MRTISDRQCFAPRHYHANLGPTHLDVFIKFLMDIQCPQCPLPNDAQNRANESIRQFTSTQDLPSMHAQKLLCHLITLI